MINKKLKVVFNVAHIKMYEVNCCYDAQPTYQKILIINRGDTEALRGEICRVLKANRYAVIYYSEEIVILVDEVAAYRKCLPIWSITLTNGAQMDIPGKMLFVRTWPTEKGMKLQHIRAEDIFHIRCFANIKHIGWTDEL